MICPKCENGQLKIQYGRFGGYIGCSNYPDCKFNSQLLVGDKEMSNSQEPVVLGKNDEGLDISLRIGPYGPYVQLGESDDSNKPKRISLPKNLDIDGVTLEVAKQYLSLPKNIGSHPETGKMIVAGIGKFGPFVRHDKVFASIPKSENIFEIGINRAVDLITSKQMKPVYKYKKYNRKAYKKFNDK